MDILYVAELIGVDVSGRVVPTPTPTSTEIDMLHENLTMFLGESNRDVDRIVEISQMGNDVYVEWRLNTPLPNLQRLELQNDLNTILGAVGGAFLTLSANGCDTLTVRGTFDQ